MQIAMEEVVLVMILLPNIVANSNTVSDVVRNDTNFYYNIFPTFPSKKATLEYSLLFNNTKIKDHCGGDECMVFLDIYTTEHDRNFQMN